MVVATNNTKVEEEEERTRRAHTVNVDLKYRNGNSSPLLFLCNNKDPGLCYSSVDGDELRT